MKPRLVYTTGQAAAIIGCGIQKMIRAFDRGDIGGFRVPSSKFRKIRHSDLLHYFEVTGARPCDPEWASHAFRSPPYTPARELAWIHDTRPNYTTEGVAEILGISSRTVGKWCDDRLLPSHRLPGSAHRRIRKTDLIEFCLHHGLFYSRDLDPTDILWEQPAGSVLETRGEKHDRVGS